MNIKAVKNFVRRNRDAIISVSSIAVIVGLVVIVVHNAKNEIANIDIEEINKKLAEGTATAVQSPDGSIHVFW